MDFFLESVASGFPDLFGGLMLVAVLFLFSIPTRIFRGIRLRINAKAVISRLRGRSLSREVIENSLKNYIEPYSSSVDPSLEEEPRNALVVVREPLFDVMDKLIDSDGQRKKYVLLLADSGMGKTSFFVNYFHRRNVSSKYKTKAHYIELSNPNSDEEIKSINGDDRRDIDLFLDALDEDDRAKSRVEDRVKDILKVAYGFNSVVISCRTQFFQSEKDIPEDTSIHKSGPVGLNESKTYIFRRLYISPFDDRQIDRYIRKVYPGLLSSKKKMEARKIIEKIPSLSVRPMLLSHIPEVIKSRREIRYSCDLYEIMINAWLVRESHWVQPGPLRKFSEKLAFEMLTDRSNFSGHGATVDEIKNFCEKNKFNINLGNLTSRSLLNRGLMDRFKFSHRSIMEYLAVEHIYKERISEIEITDQMYFFFLEKLGIESNSANRIKGIAKTKFVKKEEINGHMTDLPLFNPDRFIDGGLLNSPIVTEFNGVKLDPVSTIRLVVDHIGEMLRKHGIHGKIRSELRIQAVDFGKKTKSKMTFFTDQVSIISDLTLDFSVGFGDLSSSVEGRIARSAHAELNFIFRDLSPSSIVMISVERSIFLSKRSFKIQSGSHGGRGKTAVGSSAVSWSRITSNSFYLNILAEGMGKEDQYLAYGIFGDVNSTVMEDWGSPRVISAKI